MLKNTYFFNCVFLLGMYMIKFLLGLLVFSKHSVESVDVIILKRFIFHTYINLFYIKRYNGNLIIVSSHLNIVHAERAARKRFPNTTLKWLKYTISKYSGPYRSAILASVQILREMGRDNGLPICCCRSRKDPSKTPERSSPIRFTIVQ